MRFALGVATVAVLATAAGGQDTARVTARDSARAPRGSEILIPVGSWFLPGLGQYIHRATGPGLAHTAAFAAGFALGTISDLPDTADLPRRSRDQLGDAGFQVATSAMWLSSWDAFHRAVPRLQRDGKYAFLPPRENLGQLLSAPFDFRFLKRWTTWIDLGQTVLIAAIGLSEREAGEDYYALRGQDLAYAGSLSLNAAVGEEAWFRGYLLPMLHQKFGRRFWIANATQAGVFAVGHLPPDALAATFFTGWAMWEGWVVRRNNWSVRESVFHHFWFDFVVVSVAFMTDKRPETVRITLPPLRF
jgi:membrane protease YdiL (CAAX protease family)